jgi:hypothetical protein
VGQRRRRSSSGVRRWFRALDDRGGGELQAGIAGVELVALAWASGGAAVVGEDIEPGDRTRVEDRSIQVTIIIGPIWWFAATSGKTFMSLP